MLKKIRTLLAAVFFVAITLLFLDFTGALHAWLGWMAKIQFLPAVLALHAGVIAGLVVLTLVCGRIYCSVICPMGVLQDLISRLRLRSDKWRRKRRPFGWSAEKKWLRYGVWALFVAALIAGVQVFVALLAPYSGYGRIVQNLFQPLYLWGNNLLAALSERMGSYTFYTREVWMRSLPTFLIAAATFAVIFVLAWRGGRTWCNTICPVGTTLSFFSRFALLRPVIDADKCRNCKACERGCKASCIHIAEHKIDYSRCVDCFNCLGSCKFDALHYRFAYGRPSAVPDAAVPAAAVPDAAALPDAAKSVQPGPGSSPAPAETPAATDKIASDRQGAQPKTGAQPEAGASAAAGQRAPDRQGAQPKAEALSAADRIASDRQGVQPGQAPDAGRRAFLTSAALFGAAATLGAQQKKVDGGFAAVLDKEVPVRDVPLTPFGSEGAKHFYSRCTACQLCVAECPNNVLRPSASWEHLMQPELSYERGYCRPECVRCSEVCPAGAIRRITPEEKTAIHIGTAHVNRELCVVETNGVNCGNCARHCPSGAIQMVPKDASDPDSLRIPAVLKDRCIGCGACENLCPARPVSAITVNGLEQHVVNG